MMIKITIRICELLDKYYYELTQLLDLADKKAQKD